MPLIVTKEEEEEEWPTIGSFVLAKLPPHPHWPAVVGPCSLPEWNHLWRRPYRSGTLYWVYFYNSYQGEWVSRRALAPFTNANVESLCCTNRPQMPWTGPTAELAGAVDEARDRMRELTTRPPDLFTDHNWLPVKGSVVLARLEIHPYWPAVIVPSTHRGNWRVGDAYNCRFLPLGDENWIPLQEICRYERIRAESTRVRRNNIQYEEYMRALEMADKMVQGEDIKMEVELLDEANEVNSV